jgi:hypothetical protein
MGARVRAAVESGAGETGGLQITLYYFISYQLYHITLCSVILCGRMSALEKFDLHGRRARKRWVQYYVS